MAQVLISPLKIWILNRVYGISSTDTYNVRDEQTGRIKKRMEAHVDRRIKMAERKEGRKSYG